MDLNQDKMRATDRVLVLELIDGKLPKSSTGMVDPRIFKGENRLRAVKDPETNMWYLKYDQGGVPAALNAKFTGFKALLRYTEAYFKLRNLKVKEVID